MQRQFNRNLKRFGVKLFGNKTVGGFTTEYQTIYDAFTIKPSAEIATAQNTLVKSLVDSGVWAKLDTFDVLAGHTNDNGESLINWVNPGIFNATAVNAPTFTALEGFKGNGTTQYINMNWNPSVDGINYIQNSASIGSYCREAVFVSTGMIMGSNDSVGDLWIQIHDTPPRIIVRLNDGDNSMDVVSSGGIPAFYIASRTAANVKAIYRNKVLENSNSVASDGLANMDLYGLARNNSPADLFVPYQESLLFSGGGMTQVDVNNLTDAFEAYMDSNGKGVIP